MGLGPLVGDAATGGRDLVFVSYSHHDAQWAQRFRVLLKWLHDPGREGALNLVADQSGQRDRRLREICERLITLAPLVRSDLDITAPVGRSTPPVDAVHAGSARAARAELSGVPALPRSYLVRDELAAVIEAVIAVDGGAVGLTGAVSAVGLHGQGGIGKSVLATAVARDDGICRCFPDGVYWVSVGEKADVLAVQLELLARLGVRERAPRTPAEALPSVGRTAWLSSISPTREHTILTRQFPSGITISGL